MTITRSGCAIPLLLLVAATANADIEATPENNSGLKAGIGTAFGGHVTGSIAGLIPAPLWISIPGETLALASDITLKGTPPSFARIPDKVLAKDAAACHYDLKLDITEAERKNIFGLTFLQTPGQEGPVRKRVDWDIDKRDWMPLADTGEVSVFHLHTDVRVSVSHPAIKAAATSSANFRGNPVCADRIPFNDDACFEASLPEGIHPFQWQAQTLLNPVGDIVIPTALYAFMIYSEVKFANAARKINKNGDVLEEIIRNPGAERFVDPAIADEIRLDLVRKLLKLERNKKIWDRVAKVVDIGSQPLTEVLLDDVSIARNTFTQLVTVPDTHTPSISVSRAHLPFEATDFGGTRLARVIEQMTDVLDYSDDCRTQSELRLIHDAPNILPIGSGTVTWTVTDVPPGVDPNAFYAAGFDSSSSVQIAYTVADTQPPILIAPDGKVLVSSQSTVNPANLDLGKPRVIDLADPAPTVVNDAPTEFDVDSRIAINWTATDASNNSVSKLQWLTAKSPNTNTPPLTGDVSASTRTAEAVMIRLEGIDTDRLPTNLGMPMVDPLSFEIADYPENGEFVAPLRPFFIEDFRLTPVGTMDREGVRTSPLGNNAEEFAALPDAESRAAFLEENYCDEGNPVPVDFAYQPTYVHVADSGNYYVRDSFWECTGLRGRNTPVERERISKWSEDRVFIRHYQLRGSVVGFTHADIFTVDENENVWWSLYGLAGNVLGLQRLNSSLTDIRRLVFVPLLGTDGRAWTNAHGDPNSGLVFVNDNRGIAVFRSGNLAISGEIGDFLLDVNRAEPIGRLTIGGNALFLNGQDCGLGVDRKFWMATDSESNLYVAEACENRIHKFGPSRLNADGDFVAGSYEGWMGRCGENIPPWSGCDEENQTTLGFACDDGKCLRTASAGTKPGQFDRPVHIAVDPQDTLYVADFSNKRVQRFGNDGSFAGQAVSEGSGINTGDEPGFVLGNIGEPRAVAVNSSTLFVMQSSQNFDYFLHSFKTIPFEPIETSAAGLDADGDGYEDNAVTVNYVPRFDFPGKTGQPVAQDTFRYRVSDGLAESAVATATITVNRNFRPPEDLAINCYSPLAPARRIGCRLPEDSALLVEFIASDPDGIIGFDGLDALTYTAIQPAHGDLTLQSATAAAATYLYTPVQDFNGIDTFSYSVTDNTTMDSGGIVNVQASFELDVLPVPDPPVLTVDEPPVAGRGHSTLVTASYTDVDDDPAEIPPTLTVDWGDGSMGVQGEIVEDANGQLTATGPLLTPMTPSQGFVQGDHVFDTNGPRLVTVCLQPGDLPGIVCEQTPLDVVEATKVTVEILPVPINTLPNNLFQLFNIEVTNVAPEGWDGIAARDTRLLIDMPSNLTPSRAPDGCQFAATVAQIQCALGDIMPGEVIELLVAAFVDPAVPPRADIEVEATVTHGSVDISADITAELAVIIDWTDTDVDALPDRWELGNFDGLAAAGSDTDSDADGVSDIREFQYGSNPNMADTDGDGIDDFDEVNVYMTDVNSGDSDSDGLPDGWEIEHRVDPNSLDDSLRDHDDDGLITADEYLARTDPRNPDSDSDASLDGVDNCPATVNPDQEDFDSDGPGAACDDYEVVDLAAVTPVVDQARPIVAALHLQRISRRLKQPQVEIFDSATGVLNHRFMPFGVDWIAHHLTSLSALNAIGITGVRSDGVIEIAVADVRSGDTRFSTRVLGPNWRLVDTAHAGSIIGALGENRADGQIVAELLSVESRAQVRVGFFADVIPAPRAQRLVLMGEADRQLIAALGRDSTTGRTLMQARDDDGLLISDVSLLDAAWSLNDVAITDAANAEFAVLMTRSGSNEGIILIVNTTSGTVIRQLAPAAMPDSDRTYVSMRGIKYGGQLALALLSTAPDSAASRIDVIDPVSGVMLAESSIGRSDHPYRRSLSVIPDGEGAATSELVAAFEDPSTGRHLLAFVDPASTAAGREVLLDQALEQNDSGGGAAVYLLLLLLLWLGIGSTALRHNGASTIREDLPG